MKKHMTKPKIRAILFDIDGTLVTLESGVVATQKAVEKLGLPVPDREFLVKKAFGYSYNEYFPRLFPKHKHLTEEFRRIRRSIYRTLKVDVLPNIKKVLNTLHKKDYLIGFLTTKSEITAVHAVNSNDLFYDALVTLEDIKHRKPAPDEIFMACEKLGVKPEECVMIGDDVFDIQAGKAGGVSLTIGVTTGKLNREELSKANPDHIIDDMKELLKVL